MKTVHTNNWFELDTTNTYWEHNGKHQEFLTYLEGRINWLEEDLGLRINKTLAKKYDSAARAYKRFYNDGKIPKGYAYEWLNVTADYLEQRVNQVIEKVAKALDYEL